MAQLMNEDKDKFAEAAVRIVSTTKSVDEISAVLGLVPSRTATGKTEQTELERRESRWFLDSTLPDSFQIEDHVRHLLDVLWSKRDEISTLKNSIEIDLWCTVSSGSGFAGIVLDGPILERASALGVEFTLSVYAR